MVALFVGYITRLRVDIFPFVQIDFIFRLFISVVLPFKHLSLATNVDLLFTYRHFHVTFEEQELHTNSFL